MIGASTQAPFSSHVGNMLQHTLNKFGDKCEPLDRTETVDLLDGRRGRVWGGGRGVVLYLKHLLFTYNQRGNHIELDYIT